MCRKTHGVLKGVSRVHCQASPDEAVAGMSTAPALDDNRALQQLLHRAAQNLGIQVEEVVEESDPVIEAGVCHRVLVISTIVFIKGEATQEEPGGGGEDVGLAGGGSVGAEAGAEVARSGGADVVDAGGIEAVVGGAADRRVGAGAVGGTAVLMLLLAVPLPMVPSAHYNPHDHCTPDWNDYEQHISKNNSYKKVSNHFLPQVTKSILILVNYFLLT